MSVQTATFKVCHINPAAHGDSAEENIHSPITIQHENIQAK